MINNRQAGRRRGRGGNGNGGGQRQGGSGRPDNGNRIDNRARGNANQLYEKYKNLASDAQRQGDRVNTEYYLQFADHYFRVLSESRNRFEEQQGQQRRGRDDFDAGFDNSFDGDEDYGDEGEPIRAGEQLGDEDGQRDSQRDGQRDGRREARGGRDNGPRDGQRRDERAGDGEEGGRGGARRDAAPRGDQPRRENGRAAARGLTAPASDAEGDEAAPRAQVANDLADVPVEEAAAEPRRRGRPRRERAAEPVAASGEDAPVAMDAERLPPSLGPVANETDEATEEKPRRRRLRTATGAEATTG